MQPNNMAFECWLPMDSARCFEIARLRTEHGLRSNSCVGDCNHTLPSTCSRLKDSPGDLSSWTEATPPAARS